MNEPSLYTDDVEIFIADNQLVVGFDQGKSVVLELENEQEIEITRMLMRDRNFWLQFVSALSAAFSRENQEKAIAS